MMKENKLVGLSMDFAIKIIKLYEKTNLSIYLSNKVIRKGKI